MKQNEHIILEHMPDEYYNLFWNSINILYKGGVFTSAKRVDKFCNKLQLRASYNKDKCLQGLSEMMFWLYSIRMNYNFEIDKQLHTKNENNNSDIDIQILKDGYKFNIEVKTPNQIKKIDESVLKISVPCRTFNKEDIRNKKSKEVICKFAQTVVDNSFGKYTAYEQTKIDDNKVIEYLRSAQTKFIYEPNSINILAISVPSQQMNDYWLYLHNPNTGIFTDRFAGKFFDKNKKVVEHSHFDKVDAIYLTNMLEGHTRCFKDFDSWKLENYCNIFFVNPFSQRTKQHSDLETYRKLLDILPNDTSRFKEEYNERKNQSKKTKIPIDAIFFFEFIHKHYYILK